MGRTVTAAMLGAHSGPGLDIVLTQSLTLATVHRELGVGPGDGRGNYAQGHYVTGTPPQWPN